MPQEFQVLQCYTCKTFQVHQVKKSTKWNCKLCGEKQSIKKVFGRGSGFDCRQHVQKLNLQRAEQDNFNNEPSFEQHDVRIETEVAHVFIHNATETRKWSKYVDVEQDKGDNSDKETEIEEIYTTDRNEYDSYKKKIKGTRKRKWQHDNDRGDAEDNQSKSSTHQPSLFKKGSLNVNSHFSESVSSNNSWTGEKVCYNGTNDGTCEMIDYFDNNSSTKPDFYGSEQNQFTIENRRNNFDNTTSFFSHRESLKNIHNLCTSKSSEKSIHGQPKIMLKKSDMASSSTKGVIVGSSKWGKFVEEKDEISSEESDNEQNIFIDPSEMPQYSSSSSQEDIQNSPTCQEYFHHKVETSKVVTAVALNTKNTFHEKSNQFKVFHGNYFDNSLRPPLADLRENQGTGYLENSRDTDISVKNQMLHVNSSLFKVDDLNDDDFDFDI